MVIDARDLEPGTLLSADLCIVGGGTAGLTLAREFIGTKTSVCVIESGGREPEAATGVLDRGENVGFPYYPLHTARARGLGGSSTLWHVPLGGDRVGARMRPLDAIDFERRDWVPHSGWPFGKADLDACYERAQHVCRIGPASFEVADWDSDNSVGRAPALDADVQPIVYKFCERDLFARAYPAAVAAAPNVTTCLHASAVEVVTGESGGRVERIDAATLTGRRFSVQASTFVLAVGGIETPRLLLLSNRRHASGLGNEHDLVGRFFMEHPHFWSGLLVPRCTDLFRSTTLFNDVRTVGGTAVIGKLALREETLRRERLLNQNVQLFIRRRPDPFTYRPIDREPVNALKTLLTRWEPARAGAHVRSAVVGWRQIAATAARRARGPLPTTPVFVFANMAEQVPNRASRVLLGDAIDPLGQRTVRLDWQLTRQDIDSVIRTQEILGGALERAGWGRFHRELREATPPPDTHGGFHHMGTTRMHTDLRQGVVNPDCRIHGIANAYIAGPSVFPTGGYANPMLTIVALTLRLADHLKRTAAGAQA